MKDVLHTMKHTLPLLTALLLAPLAALQAVEPIITADFDAENLKSISAGN